ncbi:BaiN/RdsA family NAD(P)/FAD-dependent oxidoreductase [Serinibacter arcticus]|uniref:NAD(P)/FAD-dependent oxidoreductase n=1 Tax=Serinibacter arcticus TaxID=1655435 RepID=UPI001E3304B8|nr:TIGR03862 family flavoprotein [Serinibacter arcticus]
MTTASVVGGGPAGLTAAEVLAAAGVDVTVHERKPSTLRKLLIAGHGGLNITHSEDRAPFIERYGSSAARLSPALDAFSPDDLRDWCEALGEPTFVGSSRRVFPETFRANSLVRAWRSRLAEQGVVVASRERWVAWGESEPDAARSGGVTPSILIEESDGAVRRVAPDVVVLALGGGSWPRLGSDGSWTPLLAERGVVVSPLRAANVGLRASWSTTFAERFAGVPLKHVALRVRTGDRSGVDAVGTVSRGDAMLTTSGIEGGPVYAVGAAVRDVLDADGTCVLEVDLRPDLTRADLADRLRRRRPKDSASSWLRRSLGLDPVSIGLLREAGGGALPPDADGVAALVKGVPVTVTGTMPLERAISTAGGIAWSEVDDGLMLRRLPGVFAAGEMLDWEAPTGGYLLQASFSTGVLAARGALAWLASG